MAYASRSGRAKTNPSFPQAHAICDRCGFRYNHIDLSFQYQWAGKSLINKNILVCKSCYDRPQDQLRALLIPADPVPIKNPRIQDTIVAPANLRATSGQNSIDKTTGLPIIGGNQRSTQTGDSRVTQQTGTTSASQNVLPGTDPNAPGDASPGLPPLNVDVPDTGPLK